MRTQRIIAAAWLVTGLLLPLCTTPAWAQAAAAPRSELNREQVERRLSSVETLLETSSAARQIERSGDARAATKRQAARDTHGKARQAFQSGDLQKTHELLNQASAEMFEAVRFASPGDVSGPKKQADYAARRESVQALLGAQQRIAAEKGGTPASAETTAAVQKQLREADELAAAGKMDEARVRLDQAYLIARAAVSAAREGETLVRSLSFATKEEEYKYELDRNDTHRMLMKLLAEEKRQASMNKMVDGFLEKASKLRAEAESAFGKGETVDAIRLLDESTRELVRAIRSSGIFIPG